MHIFGLHQSETMKQFLPFILLAVPLLFSCKKKNTTPESVKSFYHLTHSGIADSSTFLLDTTSVSGQLIAVNQDDAFLSKSCDIETWISGPYIGDSASPAHKRITLDFSFLVPYTIQEYDYTCDCLPPLSPSKLTQFINDPAVGWNDMNNDVKELVALEWDSEFGNGSYYVVNPQIHAESMGNAIRIYGTVDSLKLSASPGNRYVTGLQFDYIFPLNP